MKPLNSKLLQNFIKLALQSLHGEWVLLGGALLPTLGIEHRNTTDIDFLGLSDESYNDRALALMKLCDKLELPIETINQGALFFLLKINNFRKDLIVLEKNKRCTLFRPNITLFIKLKLDRFSESDYLDCLAMIKWSQKNNEKPNFRELRNLIKQKTKKANPEKRERYEALLMHI